MSLQDSLAYGIKKIIRSVLNDGYECRAKDLELFFLSGNQPSIQVTHAARLTVILAALDAAETPADINLPGFNLHPLRCDFKGIWSVKVSGNWRVTFRFEAGSAYVVNYQDCH